MAGVNAWGMSVHEWLLEIARRDKAENPEIVLSTDDTPTVLDKASGRTWKITLEEF